MTMCRELGGLRAIALCAAIGIGGWLALPLASSLPQDLGAAGAWQKILKLGTTASAMHTTAHPDDEHGGMLALLSRRDGARVSLLTLNRGESGDNAIGPQLFDALGLIRTEELRVSDRYYGVDDQYFATVTDYGFSKRIDEAFEKWGKDNVMRDVVRVIRMNRPLVLVSRFQGTQRDGHGNHQTAGLITTEAFKMAGDPAAFPEQIAEGLRPWQPLKVYIGGMREDEDWQVRVDAGEYSPWLGDSYNTLARLGLSFQRSQNSGRFNPQAGPSVGYYRRVGTVVEGAAKEQGFFDGIDTSIPGLFRALRRPEPAGAADLLAAIDRAAKDAAAAFTMTDPAAALPALTRGLTATRAAIAGLGGDLDAVFVLQIKARQFEDAINAALGIDFTALAQPAGLTEPTGMMAMFAAPPAMTAPVPGSTFEIRARLTNRSRVDVAPSEIGISAAVGWTVERGQGSVTPLKYNQSASQRFNVSLASDVAPSSRPYFSRPSVLENRYTIEDMSQFGRPASAPPAVAFARYRVNGVDVEIRDAVRRREPKLPYGDVLRELRVVPALALTVAPASAVIPLKAAVKQVTITVDLLNNHEGEIAGQLALKLPPKWKADPASQAFAFARAGERATYRFKVLVPSVENRTYSVEAVATAGGRDYREGYDVIDQRDLEVRYLYRTATTDVKGIEVDFVPNLNVGYVMGIGDQNPAAIAQLGYRVTLLSENDLATANLRQYDAIVTGTRAYAVREDLKTYNRRLLDYVREGGNLVVLYNTAEFQPNRFAPYPAELTQRAEEVSEEDSPVDILAPTHQAFNWPNKISKADFDGWVEQRGSKFWSGWDKAYTPMLSSWDRGQEPQKGGWVWTRHGKGNYTYFAYAFHRQLPYGVPGAYRLLANVLALGKTPARPAARPAAAGE